MTRPLKRDQLPRARARSIRAASCSGRCSSSSRSQRTISRPTSRMRVLAHLLGDDRPRRVLRGRAEGAVEVLPVARRPRPRRRSPPTARRRAPAAHPRRPGRCTWARQPGTPSRSSRTNEYDSSQRLPPAVGHRQRQPGAAASPPTGAAPRGSPPAAAPVAHRRWSTASTTGTEAVSGKRAQAVGHRPLHRGHPDAEVLDDRRDAGVGVVDHHAVGRLP